MLRFPALTPVVLAVLALTAAPAAAETLTPTPNPLPGSAFQGADGDQVPAPPYTDWATLQAASSVERSPDPNEQDSAFSGGDKENEPGQWEIVSQAGGVTPGKSNILDAWSSIDEAGAATFLYLSFARAAATGTAYLTFELNRDRRLWDNGNSRIPCRLDGDLLITFQPSGNDVDAIVQRWRTATTDVDSGCASTGG